MNLEQIDTRTTAGKAEVMRLAAEGRRVAARCVSGWVVAANPWVEIPNHGALWDWRSSEYAIISEPVGPEEVWAIVFPTHLGLFQDEASALNIAIPRGLPVTRYRRADLAGEKG